METAIKIGDRYEFKDKDSWFIYEYTSTSGDLVIIDSEHKDPNNYWTIGETTKWEPEDDKYLGNFAKSENFSNLYSILCEE